jgi:hypothetical protein
VDTFKRMIDTDDAIGSGVDFLTTCMAARIGRYKHKSKEITSWVNNRLEEIDGGWNNKVKEMLSATWAGYFVGEKLWANTENGFCISHLAPLPPTTVLFEVDRTGRLTDDGILQFQRNWNPFALSQGAGFLGGILSGNGFLPPGGRPDPFARLGDLPFPLRTANVFNYLSIRIPKLKCVHYAFDAQGKFDNPYGRSLLRRCYKYYVLKDAILKMLATALDRKGTPLTAVWVDPNTTFKDPRLARQGNVKGTKVGVNAMEQVREVMKNIHNDSVVIFPGKKEQWVGIESLTQESNAEAFISSIDMCNKAIMRGLLIPALVFQEGGSGFSLGEQHAKTFDKILDGQNAGLKSVLLHQLIKEMLAYNFPKSAWQKDGTGDFQSRELSIDERQKEAQVCESMVNMGAADINDLNDLNEIRAKGGFSERDTPIPVENRPGAGLGMEDDGFGDLGGGGAAGGKSGKQKSGNSSGVPKRKAANGAKKG